jgi:elongation factor G
MELYRYGSILRSLTGGRGVHSEQFSRYEEMPREIEQRVIDEAKKARTSSSSPAR